MRKVILAAALLSGACPLAGCNGTTTEYTNCVHALKAQDGVYESTAKNVCIDRYQTTLDDDLSGKAGPNDPASGYPAMGVLFSGDVENKSRDHIVTSFTVEIDFPDGRKATKTFIDKFIQPGSSNSFAFLATEDLKEFSRNDFELNDGKDGRPKWTWGVIEVKGLKVS